MNGMQFNPINIIALSIGCDPLVAVGKNWWTEKTRLVSGLPWPTLSSSTGGLVDRLMRMLYRLTRLKSLILVSGRFPSYRGMC